MAHDLFLENNKFKSFDYYIGINMNDSHCKNSHQIF